MNAPEVTAKLPCAVGDKTASFNELPIFEVGTEEDQMMRYQGPLQRHQLHTGVLQSQLRQSQLRQSQLRGLLPSFVHPVVLATVMAAVAGCSGEVDSGGWENGEQNPANPPGTPDTNPPGVTPSNTPVTPGETPTSVTPGVTPPGTPPVTPAPGTPTVTPPGTPTVAPPAIPPPGAELSNCTTPGPRQIRRLSPVQYQRTLQAIFNDPSVPHEDVLSLPSVLGFHVDADAAVVRDLDGELLMNYAESVADWAVENGKISQFTSCTNAQAQCQTEFIQKLGEKAHREPLSQDMVNTYLPLFTAETTFEDGARAVLSAMLQSPYTIYRRELGVQQGNEFVLTPYEVASQLSYLITDGPPDAQLYEAAKNGQLSTSEQLLAQADRLLATDTASETLANFVEGWLEVDKLTSKAKTESILPLPDELRQSMIGETQQLFINTFKEGGSFADLFNADYTYIDQRLASHYGMGGGGGESFTRADLSGTDRATGVLGHASFLTTHALSDNSSPVQRAKIVIERLVCSTLPPVPQGLDTSLDTTTQFKTNRERYEAHRSVEPCKTCHATIDPIGYTFENYDGFGRYRTQENGIDIDASGEITQIAPGNVALDGLNSLSQALSASPEAQACLVRYWSYYAYGTDTWANIECNRDNVIRYAQAQNFSLKSVLQGVIQGPNFSRRVADQ